MKVPAIVALTVTTAWTVVWMLLVLASESIGMLWFLLNMPLSGVVEKHVGIGTDNFILFGGMVTLVNGLILGCCAFGVTLFACRICRSRLTSKG